MDEEEIPKAVALRYDPEKDSAPRVLALGKGNLAEEIVARATEAGIPLYRDPVLAKALLTVGLWEEIPEELFVAVAEVLVHLLEMDQRSRPVTSG